MTLEQFMDEADWDTTYYIGACSAFFFIGSKMEYFQAIDNISDHYLKVLKARCNKLRNRNVYKDDSPYKRKLDAEADEIGKQIKNWIPFSKREVKDTWPREVDIPGTIVKIEGIEHGAYWFKHEYDHMERGVRI